MANDLDERNDNKVGPQGNDVKVIDKQLPIKASKLSRIVRVFCWIGIILLGIPTIIYYVKKTKANQQLKALQQKIQANASKIDNYMEQRVIELKNAAQLLDKAIDLDKETFTQIAAYRSGAANQDEARNEVGQALSNVDRKINIAFERYPELKAHQEIADCMQKNSYLQREITACRDLYNDSVLNWNTLVYKFPFHDLVAEENGYTTRVPYAIDEVTRQEAKGTFFGDK